MLGNVDRLPNELNDKIIVVNLKAANNTLPIFLAEPQPQHGRTFGSRFSSDIIIRSIFGYFILKSMSSQILE